MINVDHRAVVGHRQRSGTGRGGLGGGGAAHDGRGGNTGRIDLRGGTGRRGEAQDAVTQRAELSAGREGHASCGNGASDGTTDGRRVAGARGHQGHRGAVGGRGGQEGIERTGQAQGDGVVGLPDEGRTSIVNSAREVGGGEADADHARIEEAAGGGGTDHAGRREAGLARRSGGGTHVDLRSGVATGDGVGQRVDRTQDHGGDRGQDRLGGARIGEGHRGRHRAADRAQTLNVVDPDGIGSEGQGRTVDHAGAEGSRLHRVHHEAVADAAAGRARHRPRSATASQRHANGRIANNRGEFGTTLQVDTHRETDGAADDQVGALDGHGDRADRYRGGFVLDINMGNASVGSRRADRDGERAGRRQSGRNGQGNQIELRHVEKTPFLACLEGL